MAKKMRQRATGEGKRESTGRNTYVGDEDFCVQRTLRNAQTFEELHAQTVSVVVEVRAVPAHLHSRRVIEAGKVEKCRLQRVIVGELKVVQKCLSYETSPWKRITPHEQLQGLR